MDEFADLDEQSLRTRLHDLMTEHRDLDDSISALTQGSAFDQLQIQRLKRKKLHLKDQISRIQDKLVPDIIA